MRVGKTMTGAASATWPPFAPTAISAGPFGKRPRFRSRTHSVGSPACGYPSDRGEEIQGTQNTPRTHLAAVVANT